MGIAQRYRDSIRNIWSHGEEEEYERPEEEEPEPYQSNPPERSEPRYDTAPPARGGSNVKRTTFKMPVSRDKQIYTIKPHGLEEASAAADFLKTGSAVIINLDDVDRTTAVRIIDFMSGVCYGLDAQGHAMKLGATIFLFTPGDFEITSDEPDYNENTEFFFRDVPAPNTDAASQNAPAPQAAASSAAPSAAPRVADAPAPVRTVSDTVVPPVIDRSASARAVPADRVVIDNSAPVTVRASVERPAVTPRPWER